MVVRSLSYTLVNFNSPKHSEVRFIKTLHKEEGIPPIPGQLCIGRVVSPKLKKLGRPVIFLVVSRKYPRLSRSDAERIAGVSRIPYGSGPVKGHFEVYRTGNEAYLVNLACLCYNISVFNISENPGKHFDIKDGDFGIVVNPDIADADIIKPRSVLPL